MAVQYNSKDNSWSGIVVDLLKAKKGIVEVSDEATKFFEKYQKNGKNLSATIENVSKSNGFKGFIKDSKLADESLISFLKDTEYSEKTLANYQLYLKNTASGMTFFSRATKAAGSVLKTFIATLGSMAAMWVIGEVVSVVIQIIDNIVHEAEYAEKALKDVQDEIKSIKSELDSMNKTVETSAKRFAELSQGVNQLTGENSTLSTDDYQEFLSLSNQIADLFPSLTRIYNKNGDAIIQLSGDIDTIVDSLNNLVAVQRQLANQQLADKLPDIFDNTKKVYRQYEKELKPLEERAKQLSGYILYLKGLPEVYGTEALAEYDDANRQNMGDMFIETAHWKSLNQNFESSLAMYAYIQSEFEKELNATLNKINFLEQTKMSKFQYNSLNQALAAWLYVDYSTLGDDVLAGVQMTLNGIDWGKLTLKNSEEAQEYIKENLIVPLQTNTELQDLFLQLFSLDSGDLDRVEIAEKIQNILDGLKLDFDIMPVVSTEKSAKERLENSVRSLMGNDHIFDTNAENAMIDSTIAEIEKLAGKLTPEIIDIWLRATCNSNSVSDALQSFTNALADKVLEDSSAFSLTENQSKAISEYQSDLEKLQKTLSNIDNLTSADVASLMTDFSEYASVFENYGVTELGEGNIEAAIQAISDKIKAEVIKTVPELQSYFADMYEAALNPRVMYEKSLAEFNNLVGIYNSVKDAQTLDFEHATKLINKYPELASKVKIVGEAYSFEEDAIASLINARVEDVNTAAALEARKIQLTLDAVNARIKAFQDDRNVMKGMGLSGYLADRQEKKRLEQELAELEERIKEVFDISNDISSNTVFDWYATALDRTARSIDNLSGKADDLFSTFPDRNKALIALVNETTRRLDIQRNAKNAYLAKAQSIGLSKDYIQLIKDGYRLNDGVIGIQEVSKGDAEKINEYTQWYEKYLDMIDAIKDSETSLQNYEAERMDNIQKFFDMQMSTFENRANMLNAMLDNAEAHGYIGIQMFYERLIETEQGNLRLLHAEKKALEEAFQSSDIKEGSEKWYELQKNIAAVAVEIQEATNNLLDFQNKIREINWEIFDFSRGREDAFTNEVDFLVDLLRNGKMYDDVGNITADGTAAMGLHALNYNAYYEQSIAYAKELASINRNLEGSPADTKLIERREELLELQQEAILSAESEKEAIRDLVSNGIELQKEAFQELIDEYENALDVQKDLYDYQRKTADQTKRIAQIQKQLAAYSGDNSDEARSQVQKLSVKLEEAQNDLRDSQYDRYISDQKEILGEIYDNYETAMDNYIGDINGVVSDAISQVNLNSNSIKETIRKNTQLVGYDITTELDSLLGQDSSLIFRNGFDAVKKAVEVNAGVLTDTQVSVTKILGDIQAQLQKLVENTNSDSSQNNDNSIKSAKEYSSEFNTTTNKWSFFKKKLNNDNKNNYDPNSIVDRLRYYNYDDSFASRKYYYSSMGFGGDYQGTDEQNISMLRWMLEHKDELKSYATGGYNLRKQMAWTQDGGSEYIIRKSDGAILTPINNGDSVLNAAASTNLRNMTNDPGKFISEHLRTSIPNIQKSSNVSNQFGDISITIPLENVADFNDFIREFQNSSKVEGIIKSVLADAMGTGSSLSKYKW